MDFQGELGRGRPRVPVINIDGAAIALRSCYAATGAIRKS